MLNTIIVIAAALIIYLVYNKYKKNKQLEKLEKLRKKRKALEEHNKGSEERIRKILEETNYLQNINFLDINTIKKDDYRSLYHHAQHMASKYIEEKNYNKAFEYLNKEEMYCYEYFEKDNSVGWTLRTVVSLCSSVYEKTANIHRLEKRHNDAFACIIYAHIANISPTQRLKKKLIPYYNRAKLKNTDIEEIKDFIGNTDWQCSYSYVHRQMKKWINREDN